MDNKAYTLIESLVVLFIISIMLLIVTINPKLAHNELVFETLFQNLSSDLYYAQIYAEVNETPVSIIFKNHSYHLKAHDEIIKSYYYEQKLKISSNFTNHTVIYNRYGNIQQAGVITFCTKQICQQIVFNLGNGRFYFKE